MHFAADCQHNPSSLTALAELRHGQFKSGVEKSPARLLSICNGVAAGPQAGDGCGLSGDGLRVVRPDVEFSQNSEQWESNVYAPERVGKYTRELCSRISQSGSGIIHAIHKIPQVLVFGGDHSIALGSVAASALLAAQCCADPGIEQIKCPDLVLFWIDAHSDINTPSTTNSGALHGCPVSLLAGIDAGAWQALQAHMGWIDAELVQCNRISGQSKTTLIQPCRVVYIGIRDVEAAEQMFLDKFDIVNYPMSKVVKRGRCVGEIVREALAIVDPRGECAIHCSFDIDALDPAYAPSTGTPVADGLTVDEGVAIVTHLKSTGRLMAMDLVEVNLELGSTLDQSRTLESARKIMLAFKD